MRSIQPRFPHHDYQAVIARPDEPTKLFDDERKYAFPVIAVYRDEVAHQRSVATLSRRRPLVPPYQIASDKHGASGHQDNQRCLRLEHQAGLTRTHLTPDAASLLTDAVSARRRILVTGKVATGKTTLVECLADLVGQKDGITSVEVIPEIVFRLGRDVQLVDGKGSAPKTWPSASAMKDRLLLVNDLTMNGEHLGPDALKTAAFGRGCLMSSSFARPNTPNETGHIAERMTQRLREWSSEPHSVIDMIVCVDNRRMGWWIESDGPPGPWIESIWDLTPDWKLTRRL